MARRQGVIVLVLAATLLVLGVGVVGLAVVDRPRVQSVDDG